MPGGANQSPLDVPPPIPDSTLIALTQLGVFKLSCNRAFVSLIDRSHQHIISEATHSTSLLLSDLQAQELGSTPDDALYLGFRSLELNWGVCPMAMQVFTSDGLTIETENITADRSRYIIRDFCADADFSTRPYVTDWPYMRSYAEVPIVCPGGYVIGSYCVIDDKPREFHDADIATLNEIASTIMNHLDLLKTKREFDRMQSLVRGIGSYAAGYSGISEVEVNSETQADAEIELPIRDPTSDQVLSPNSSGTVFTPTTNFSSFAEDTSTHTKDVAAPTVEGFTYTSRPSLSKLRSVSSDTIQTISSGTKLSAKDESSTQTAHSNFQAADESVPQQNSEILVSNKSQITKDSNAAPSDVRAAYIRASTLIRQSMELEGVVFLVCLSHSHIAHDA